MNPHLYETLLFLHILFAIVWVGGAIAIQFFVYRIVKRETFDQFQWFGQDIEWMGTKVFSAASGLLFLIGLVMVAWGPWEWSDPFIVIGIVGFLATFVTGLAYLGPTSKKIAVAMQEGGDPAGPEMGALRKKIITISRVDLVVLIIVTWAMVYKPGS